jgi:ubiquinone/menaquinone biosynthesis C-methylase UbiE
MARDHRPENRWTVAVLDAQPADRILEIGFGAGVAIEALSGVVGAGQITGVDFSPTMLRAARRRNAAAIRAGRVRLLCADAVDLPLAAQSFDQAYSIHSIYFWSRPAAALAEIWRVLRPGGRLVLTILPRELWNIDSPDLAVGTPECRPYTGAELSELLHAAGFSASSIAADTNPAWRSNYCVVGVK